MKGTNKAEDRNAKAAQAKYLREWRARNRERVREYNLRYWKKKAAQMENEEKDGGEYAEENL